MTDNDHIGPFTTPLPDPASDLDGHSIGDQIRDVMYALGEVKKRVANGPRSSRTLVRRLYQLEAAAQHIWSQVFDIERRVQRNHADVLLATALTGYEVGRDYDDPTIHIADMNADVEPKFLCGARIAVAVGNLDLLYDSTPLCDECSIEFTRRVFTPGALLIDDEDTELSETDEQLDRRLRNLSAYLESYFQNDLNDARRREAFLKKLDAMRAAIDQGVDPGGPGTGPDSPPPPGSVAP